MKRLAIAGMALIACVSAANAQRAESVSTSFFSTERSDQPITIGIRGGVNFAKVKAQADNVSVSADNIIGYNVGLSVDFPLLQSLYLQSGLYWTAKGYTYKEEGESDTKYHANYLEIPVYASYRYNFTETTQLQVNFGPYIAYGINGKVTNKDWGDEEGKFFGDGDDGANYNRFDAGLGVGVGMTFNKFYVGLDYKFGLTNMVKDAEDYSEKSRNLSISVGYNF